jgi:hypothetical protein
MPTIAVVVSTVVIDKGSNVIIVNYTTQGPNDASPVQRSLSVAGNTIQNLIDLKPLVIDEVMRAYAMQKVVTVPPAQGTFAVVV